jgi:hypothetical protein
MSFKTINFGRISAEDEQTYSPELLINGFFDDYGYIDAVRSSEKFLIIGPKGSGKSAIGSKLELDAQQDLDHESDSTSFVKNHLLENFPYESFGDILPKREGPEITYPESWEFILMVACLNSFIKDNSFDYPRNYKTVFQTLIKLGLLAKDDKKLTLEKIVKTTTSKQIRATLKVGIVFSSSQEKITDTKKLYTYLKECFYSIIVKNKHYIIIDGLDIFLTKGINQLQSITALVIAADRMNKTFYRNGMQVKIIVMCRTDMFERLSKPDKNKIKLSGGIILDWFQNTPELESTNLAKLINLRAKLSLGKEINVFETFLPQYMNSGKSSKKTIQVLFDHTRHLPRDMIMLFKEIQDHTKENDFASVNDIQTALGVYSKNYFIGEIKDQLYGFLSNEDIEKIFQLLAKTGWYRFNITNLEEAIRHDGKFSTMDLDTILNALFNCNAIGNIDRNTNHVTYKFRNQYAEFNPKQSIVVHYGLQRGLNLNRAKY